MSGLLSREKWWVYLELATGFGRLFCQVRRDEDCTSAMLYSQAVPSTSLQILESVSLAPYTTLQIGGPARFFCEVTSEAELLEALAFAHQRSLKIFVLGGGSNLLVEDGGFDGLVIHIDLRTPMRSYSAGNDLDVTVAAGTDWNAFVLSICEQRISGVECLAGIPGTVGGTPVQNVGAYGQEVAETIREVRVLDLESLAFATLSREACGFSYRGSIFNTTHRNRYIVTQVSFRFDRSATPRLTYADLARHFAGQIAAGQVPTPIDVYHAVREIRHGKGMLIVEGEVDCRSAGSFFKNPIVPGSTLNGIAANLSLAPGEIPHWPGGSGLIKLPAAWLLERAGFTKGFALGRAGISSRHTLALINRGGATAADITALRDLIQREVRSRFGIALEQEPVQLGS
jgi:UDP-N-acetylmuramate dehydrogenase